MRITLPSFLVLSILRIAHARDASPDGLSSPGMTLWEVGFSIQDSWANFRDQAECPAPSTPVVDVDPDPKRGEVTIETEAVQEPSTVPPEPDAADSKEAGTKEEPLVSFEDWKRLHGDVADTPEAPSSSGEAVSTVPLNESIPTSHAETSATPRSIPQTTEQTSTPQPFSTPQVHNKYNYASPDCSARIHSSSSQTQHASSLLHKSRDRYMLTPCKADQHWVVVELCDEIRIEAIELSVWEFFSGIVRDVKVSVGGEDMESDADSDSTWQEVGAFAGKNVRGAQVSCFVS